MFISVYMEPYLQKKTECTKKYSCLRRLKKGLVIFKSDALIFFLNLFSLISLNMFLVELWNITIKLFIQFVSGILHIYFTLLLTFRAKEFILKMSKPGMGQVSAPLRAQKDQSFSMCMVTIIQKTLISQYQKITKKGTLETQKRLFVTEIIKNLKFLEKSRTMPKIQKGSRDPSILSIFANLKKFEPSLDSDTRTLALKLCTLTTGPEKKPF